MDEAFLPTRAAAQYLDVSASTLLRAVRRGVLVPNHRTPEGYPRFDRATLDAYARVRASGTARAPAPAPPDTWMGADSTARQQAEDALQRSAQLFRALWEHTNDSVVILHADGTYRYVSPSRLRVLGRTPEEMMGGAPTAHMHPDDLTWAGPRLAAVLRTPGAVDTVVARFRHKNGSWRWLVLQR